ncbi:atp-dependent rna helicase dhx8 [Trichoderma arundinaceum]|uniref:Atp-dependent rna helicase dhx8 n=1 Tax=Trichoderma arundinaceum TaxID=490622 RepID=A0A395P0G8_TRIAR|nr:atp-dependent rna helicase dhx8 [Trichoderma arundinaceum]
MSLPSQTPYRQIRASFDDHYITVYQAYQKSIADAAVQAQKLNASPDFSPDRMTWIKPSWCWMMYRSGYSYKDDGQSRILALKMKREHFLGLLEQGVLSTHPSLHARVDKESTNKTAHERPSDVRVQWDPERNPKLEVLPYRSIQIGIPRSLSTKWANDWIASIEDVIEKARELKRVLDEQPDISTDELVKKGLVPEEKPLDVPDEILTRLEMTVLGVEEL